MTKNKQRRIAILSPLLIILSFVLWRYVSQIIFNIPDSLMGKLDLNPIKLIFRIVAGVDLLGISWVEPLRYLIGGKLDMDLGMVSVAKNFLIGNLLLIVLILILAICGLIVYKVLRKRETITDNKETYNIKHYSYILVGCILFVIGGYIPYCLVYNPTLNFTGTRVNQYALPGMSLGLVIIVYMIIKKFINSARLSNIVLAVCIVPLLIIGILINFEASNGKSEAWNEQKIIWNDILRTFPSFTPNTYIVIETPKYDKLKYQERPPFSADYEVFYGVKVLYNDPTLGGDYLDLGNEQIARIRFQSSGYFNANSELIPYSKLVVFKYDSNKKSAYLVDNLTNEFNSINSYSEYSPRDRIKEPNTDKPYLYLIRH
jgi:hypothetical protein